MAPVIQPDPDLRVAESGLGATLREKAQRLNSLADQIGKTEQQLATTNSGTTVDRILTVFDGVRKSLSEGADAAWAAATFHEHLAAAAARYRNDAPTVEEVLAAWALVEQTRAAKDAAEQRGGSYAAEGRAWQRAKDHLVDLQRRRTDAIAAYTADEAEAVADFQAAGGDRKVGRTSPTLTTPTTPKSAPAPPPPAAPREQPTTPAPPSAVMPPMPQLEPQATPPAPEAVTSSIGGGSGIDPSKLLSALALQQAMQPPQVAPQPQPQMFQPQPQPTTKPVDENRAPLTGDDIARLLTDAAPGAAIVGGLPLGPNGLGGAPTFTSASPAITPAATTPTYSPAAPWNTTSLAGTAPLNPVTTGTSISGLSTDNNVTGRPDNVAARTAYTPAGTATATGSHLSGTQAGVAAGSAGAAGAATAGAPVGGMPMMGGPMMGGPGGGGNGGAAHREPVTAKPGSDGWLLTGGPAMDAAVDGGTIAQRKNDAA